MTANEFLENVNDYYDLKEFCSEIGCEYCDNILSDDGLDEEVEWAIGECHREYSWREIRDLLSEVPTGYNWYRLDGTFDYVGLDEYDFADSKDEVYSWAHYNGYFDEEEAEERVTREEPEEEPLEDEDFSVADLMGMCSITLVTIQTNSLRSMQEETAAFDQFIDVNMPKVIR